MLVTSSSVVFVSAVQYTEGTTSNDVTIDVSGSGTSVELIGCNIDGFDYTSGVASAIGILCTLGATVLINNCTLQRHNTAVIVGLNTDTSNTKVSISNCTLTSNTTDIIQRNTTSLIVTSSTMALSKLVIASPSNTSLSFNDAITSAMSIGSTAASPVIISQPLQSVSNNPTFGFTPSIYNTNSFIEQSVNDLIHTVVSLGTSGYAAVTQNSDMASVIRSASDTYTPTGTTNALRYWDISKNNSTYAQLDFTFGNTDTNGLAAITPFVFMELDAVSLNMILAPSSKITLQNASSQAANLYTVNSNVLKTDGSLYASNTLSSGSLTNGYVLYSGANGVITSSLTTLTELGYLTGVTSNVQTQLNNRLLLSGGTLTGQLIVPSGTSSNVALGLNSVSSGLFYSLGVNIVDNGVISAKFSSIGLTLPLLTVGVLHSDSSGVISSSLIVGTDIATNANISNSSLATLTASGLVANSATSATSANTANSIVSRDTLGDFAAGVITASLVGNVTGVASGCLQLTGGTLTNRLILPIGSVGTPSLSFTSSTGTGLSCATANVLVVSINGSLIATFNSSGFNANTINNIDYSTRFEWFGGTMSNLIYYDFSKKMPYNKKAGTMTINTPSFTNSTELIKIDDYSEANNYREARYATNEYFYPHGHYKLREF
jgi:hypothetical protein